ncbi:MAG: hypothetical protein HFH46_00425 [Bacilli bacterium]|nr:hypothetical protein [Bacilli bacterium]
METKEETKQRKKFVNFILVNKKEIGAVLGTITLIIGIGLGVRSCSTSNSDDNTSTEMEQPDNNSDKKDMITKKTIKPIEKEDTKEEKKDDESVAISKDDQIKKDEDKETTTNNTNQSNSGQNSNNQGNNDSDNKKPNNPSTKPNPGKPDDTDKPGKPGDTDKPDDTNKPGKPDDTDKPDKPGKPDEPDKPGKPDEPDKPKPHVHSLVSDYEAHDENEKCVITRWQVCTDSSCPDGAGTHLNESVERTSHQYTKISESEIAPDLWEITDKCTVCNHTQSYFMDSSELGYSQISNIETEEYILDFSTNTVYLKEEINPIKEKQKTLSL